MGRWFLAFRHTKWSVHTVKKLCAATAMWIPHTQNLTGKFVENAKGLSTNDKDK
ncbi:MAG: hypothetical protein VX485_02230 [SAR324 cluster bacterium]|nr:hypothetical protein [SAR324 cluster bacterium]